MWLLAVVSRTCHRHRGLENSDRKSTRLNSSHLVISYAVFCLKKKKNKTKLIIIPNQTDTHLYIPTKHYSHDVEYIQTTAQSRHHSEHMYCHIYHPDSSA